MDFAMILLTIFAILRASDASWCVCRSDVNNTAMQKAIDYACGHGADCTPILQNGACYNPNNVQAHCSYAANSYYQRKSEDSATCDFGGTALITSTNPSSNGCKYPTSPSEAGTSGSGTSSSGSGTSSSGSTNGTSIQPTGSVYGLGPSAMPDNSNSGFKPETQSALWILSLVFMIIASLHCNA